MQSRDRIKKFVKSSSILIFGMIIGLVLGSLPSNLEKKYQIEAWDVGFQPGGHCQQKIINLIDRAQSNILMASYSFTSKEIANALIRAKNRAVNVKLIMDKNYYNNAVHHMLVAAGIEVVFDIRSGIMHNKVIIVDDRFVVTGSYNFSFSAETKNRENLIILDSLKVAATYIENWNQIFAHCKKISLQNT